MARDSDNLPENKKIDFGSYVMFLTFFIAPVVGVVIAVYCMWENGVDWFYLSVFLFMYLITAFGTTGGYHRLFTHESYYAKPWVKFLIAIAGSSAVQGKIFTWCTLHKLHHEKSDKSGDPHSPLVPGDSLLTLFKGLWHSQIGWMFIKHKLPDNEFTRRLKNDPIVQFVDRYIVLWIFLGGLIPASLGYMHSGKISGAFYGFLWGGLVRIFFHQHFTSAVNSICHVWGKRKYKTGDRSTDNWFIAIFTLGEGYHNGHHVAQKSALHSLDFPLADMTFLILLLMEKLGMVYNVRQFVPRKEKLETLRV
ncbi:MAG: acyl-CoA desaturase [Patescibacteria group bacterium]